ncbi:hypothetical protein KY285_032001 [Solanum tuberosum]|nr:hypothetical protein KY284_030582 [Solanum tuberosum]KAH0657119.1 hypothetical protein KY285_032001 [Solanum tuberosum]
MRDIGDLFNEEGWDFDALHDVVPEYVVDHVTHNMRFLQLEDLADKPWCTKSSTGYFSVKSVWEVLRKKENVNEDFKSLWVKGLPFKFSFLAWSIWRGKVHVANVIHAWNPNISLNCRCCNILENESINHLFLRGEIATRIWSYYSRTAGIIGIMLNVKQMVRKWWSTDGNYRIKLVYQAIPIVIMWFLWKRRNTILNGGSYSVGKVIWEINNTILKFIKLRCKGNFGLNNWPLIVQYLEGYSVVYNFKVVKWVPPPINWFKGNTDGASKGNLGPSSTAFCIRDHEGNLIVAKGVRLQETTNVIAEAIAIRECLVFCRDNMLSQIIIETDSLAMVHILEGQWEAPWSVALEVRFI